MQRRGAKPPGTRFGPHFQHSRPPTGRPDPPVFGYSHGRPHRPSRGPIHKSDSECFPSRDHPILLFVVSLVLLWLSAHAGARVAARRGAPDDAFRADYGVILAAALTLLGLIIGFSFSMAISRYDQRKNLEEAEANAIGTEYLRADLLPAADGARVRALLRQYTDYRIEYYRTFDAAALEAVNRKTAALQDELWAAVRGPAIAQPTPISAVAVVGMNDVLNSQGYTQAAWWNRIPRAAWMLMAAIAICCNFLVGYGMRNHRSERNLLLILPVVVSISFLLIADIDSPRGGLIHVAPLNLNALAESLHPH